MSHEIETTAWTNEKPWHGLGAEVAPNLTADQMLKAAKLNWTISKRPMHYSATAPTDKPNTEVPGFFALTRDSDASVLDVVGRQYEPTQNAEAFHFFKEFVEAGKATMETAGSLKGGRMIWGLANLNNAFTLNKTDKVKSYLLVASPHEQGKSLKIMFTSVRVVCNNTLTAALTSSQKKAEPMFRMNHRRKFDEDTINLAKETLGLAAEHFESFAEQALKLSKKKVHPSAVNDYFATLLQPELVNAPADKVLKEANKTFSYALQALEHAPGAQLASAKGTAWGLLNAITYTTDHLLGKTADARLNKAWFGKNSQLKQDALNLALKV